MRAFSERSAGGRSSGSTSAAARGFGLELMWQFSSSFEKKQRGSGAPGHSDQRVHVEGKRRLTAGTTICRGAPTLAPHIMGVKRKLLHSCGYPESRWEIDRKSTRLNSS